MEAREVLYVLPSLHRVELNVKLLEAATFLCIGCIRLRADIYLLQL